MTTLEQAVDIFLNKTFTKTLTERTIFCQEFVTSQAIVFNKTSYLVFDKVEGNVHYRYLYYGKHLCATHYHAKEEVDYENLVVYDYGNFQGDTIRRLYQIQRELESYLPRDIKPRSIHKMSDGNVFVYTKDSFLTSIPSLF